MRRGAAQAPAAIPRAAGDRKRPILTPRLACIARFLRAPDDTPSGERTQTFRTARSASDALDATEAYLDGAGTVTAALRGRLVRTGNDLVVHYGRVTTHVNVRAVGNGSEVHIARRGRAPLEETRRWLFGLGIIGFVLAWGLAWYNAGAQDALSPLVTITLFFLGIVATVIGLYVIDLSLERRSASLLHSLEDAVKGDALLVLQREVDGLERSSSVANAILFYCVSLLVEFLVFVILLGDADIRDNINEAVTLDVMRAVFALPVVPAILFGLVWFFAANRLHGERIRLVARRLGGAKRA